MKINSELICSVGIATFKRQTLLRELINSLYKQKDIDNLLLEIIVVDNDAEKSAEKIVADFGENQGIILKYYNQPEQNISLARNMCIEKSKGDFIAILDDDETADTYWIKNLLDTALKYNADAVFGYVEAVFPENAPTWMRQREIYFKPMGKTGDKPLFRYTTNCLLKTDFINKFNARFDPKYGLSGGEDGIFFDLLEKYGAKFAVCREAITYEYIPEYRTKLKFIFNRHFQRGNNYGIYMIESVDNRFQKARIKLFIRACIAVLYYGLQCIVFIPNKKKWIFGFIGLSMNLGKLSGILKIKLLLYKNEHNKF